MTRTLVLSWIGLIALVVNPSFACDDNPPPFSYGEVEMRSAIEGTWKLTSSNASAPIRDLAITIREKVGSVEQHASREGFVRAATACSERSFVRTAGACGDISVMELDVTAGAAQIAEAAFIIYDTVFQEGRLRLRIDGTEVSADISPTGAATRAVESRNYDNYSYATLVRVK